MIHHEKLYVNGEESKTNSQRYHSFITAIISAKNQFNQLALIPHESCDAEMLDSETEPENLLPISNSSADSLQMLFDAIANRQQIEEKVMNDEADQNLSNRINNIDNLVTKLLNVFECINEK